jgi:hypothetical protein
MNTLAAINEEMKARSTSDCRLDFYELIKEKDCFFLIDRQQCPAELSMRTSVVNFIHEDQAKSFSLDDWVREIQAIVLSGRHRP